MVNIKKQAKIWAQMEPNDVVPIVRIVGGKEPKNALMVLGQMQAEQVGSILGELAKGKDAGDAKLAADLFDGLQTLKAAPKPVEETP